MAAMLGSFRLILTPFPLLLRKRLPLQHAPHRHNPSAPSPPLFPFHPLRPPFSSRDAPSHRDPPVIHIVGVDLADGAHAHVDVGRRALRARVRDRGRDALAGVGDRGLLAALRGHAAGVAGGEGDDEVGVLRVESWSVRS